MSFDIKYDRDGQVIKPKVEPVFEQPTSEVQAVPVEQETVKTSALETLSSDIPETSEQQSDNSGQEETTAALQPQEEQMRAAERPKESHQASNFRIMKEKALAAEKRAQELEAALLAATQQKQTLHPQEEAEEEISVDADALVEGKHLSKVNKHIKKLEQQLYQYQQQTALQATEMRLKTQYPDFDKVVSKDNLESLRMTYPEIAQTLNANTDLYAKAVSAYTMIKKFGLAETDDYKQDIELIKKNASKPKPLASINPQRGDSPLAKANAFATGGELTPELKAQMLKEMNTYRNR